MKVQTLKDKLIEGYTAFLANEPYHVMICIDDKVKENAAFIHLTVFRLDRHRFTLSLNETDNATTIGKAKTLRRHKIPTNIPPDTPMFKILADSLQSSDDLDVHVESMDFVIEIDEEEDIFW